MKINLRKLNFAIYSSIGVSFTFLAKANETITESIDLKPSYDYLVNTNDMGGSLYIKSGENLDSKFNIQTLPLSYYDTADYWGKYVCSIPKNDCNVRDVFNPYDYTLVPVVSKDTDNSGANLQIERVNVHNGSDLYDAAAWQIAVVLGNIQNHFTNQLGVNAYDLVNSQNILLSANKENPNTNRAISHSDGTFVYNGNVISDPANAYSFRMITKSWLSTDPFKDTPYAHFVTATDLPKNSDYQVGKMTWLDWKPITGENAWAFLIGPLQADYIYYIKGIKQNYIPFKNLSVQNALGVLPTFAKMQSAIGGVYYVPSKTYGNQGNIFASQYEVSVENNFSLFAGLNILKETLLIQLKNDTNISENDKKAIKTALTQIDEMINGNSQTEGLLAFFRKYAWKNGEFIQGGLANDPNQKHSWIPTLTPKAVDVNTWGIAALGPKQIDEWFGFGSSYKAWKQVLQWGGYGVNNTLWGVGFSDLDDNGIDNLGNYKQGILSAEWTAGAINSMQIMINYYQSISSSTFYEEAQKYVSALKADRDSMLLNVKKLRIDNYKLTSFPEKPQNYENLFSTEKFLPYIYSSKRYMIPFGWFANPIPSTCSTAWMIMVENKFNPFSYSGVQ